MCKIVEDYAKELADELTNETSKENIKNLFKNGGTLELAIATFENISENVIREIYEEFVSSK